MKKSANGIAEKKLNDVLNFRSATELLQEWDNSVSDILLINNADTKGHLTITVAQMLSGQTNLCEGIQRLILDEMIGTAGARDKEQFIRMVQLMVTRLLDKVSSVTENMLPPQEQEVLTALTQMLLQTIYFTQEFFGTYFDNNGKIPAFLCSIYRKEIVKLGEKFSDAISQLQDVNPALIQLINEHFSDAVWTDRKHCSYKHFHYERELLQHLLKENKPTDISLRGLLYYFNFNCSSFVIYEFERLIELVTQLQTKSEKISALRTELKIINQLPARLNYSYDEDMPSLREQVSTWIEEEIRYCEAGHFIQVPANANGEIENKIHTTFSVAKLSLLIRLLVVDKIIINRTIAPMLKTVSKIFSTLQREEISFGSLETKYHAPDKATIALMKEMLQKWIVILGKL